MLIIAVICIGFSGFLYKVATDDLALGLSRQSERISNNFPVFLNSPYLHNTADLHETRKHLLQNLALLNLIVLTASGFASYALARRTLRPIEAAHEQQKRFTADVSHELRTPLTALKMESEVALLDTTATKAELRAIIASNVEEAEKLTNLVSNLLRLSQLDAMDRSKLLTSIPLADPLQAAVSQMAPVAEAKQITLSTSPLQTIAVRGDSALLTQLFVLLLDNAIKYSPAKSTVSIEISTHDGSAIISISDNGPGIAKADLEHIFDRFYRADTARSSETGGFGLGLSIAKLIADNHNASISLTSQPGKGTVARLHIATTDKA